MTEMMGKKFRGIKDVRAVYLFGSSATGKTGRLSDLTSPRTSERMQHEPRHVQREDAAQVAKLSQ